MALRLLRLHQLLLELLLEQMAPGLPLPLSPTLSPSLSPALYPALTPATTPQFFVCVRAPSPLCRCAAQVAHSALHRWRFGTVDKALGVKHVWLPDLRLGLCGDWLLGPGVEDAFVSGDSLGAPVAAVVAARRG
jgi:hypothetical protein